MLSALAPLMINTLYSNNSDCQEVRLTPYNFDAVRQGWAEYFQAIIGSYAWDWYVTLTYAKPCGRWKVEDSWQCFTKRLRRAAGHRIEWFRIVEYQRHRDPVVPHIHAVMLKCADLRRLSVKDYWDDRFGHARILPFDQGSAGMLCRYLAKDFAKDFATDGGLAYYELSRDLRKYSRAEILNRYPCFEKLDIGVVRHAFRS